MNLTNNLMPRQATSLLARIKNAAVAVVSSTLIIGSASSIAGPFTEVHFFGDSLTDTGAFNFLAPEFCPPAPYFDCRFSNGPVWAELLADDLGASADTAYGGGTNWAIGGQRSDQILGGQVPAYLGTAGGSADEDALYVIWGGGNDFLQVAADPAIAVENILNSITGLADAGASNFLIPNLPIADPWAFTFNLILASSLDLLGEGLNITQFDVFGLLLDMTINPVDYGFTNVEDPCFTNTGVCTNPDEYLLWDPVHPTAATHEFIAAAALQALGINPVSAPATLVLLLLGLGALSQTRRQKAA